MKTTRSVGKRDANLKRWFLKEFREPLYLHCMINKAPIITP